MTDPVLESIQHTLDLAKAAGDKPRVKELEKRIKARQTDLKTIDPPPAKKPKKVK